MPGATVTVAENDTALRPAAGAAAQVMPGMSAWAAQATAHIVASTSATVLRVSVRRLLVPSAERRARALVARTVVAIMKKPS